MNPLMPDAPQGAQAAAQAPQGVSPAQMSPNPLMAPQGAPTPAMPPASPQQIDEARKHSNVIVGDLSTLVSKPKGDLTKQDVFEAASDMLAKGAFPTPASRQMLVAELAKLPDDEPSLRKALGMFLLQASGAREQLLKAHGPGGAPNAGL